MSVGQKLRLAYEQKIAGRSTDLERSGSAKRESSSSSICVIGSVLSAKKVPLVCAQQIADGSTSDFCSGRRAFFCFLKLLIGALYDRDITSRLKRFLTDGAH